MSILYFKVILQVLGGIVWSNIALILLKLRSIAVQSWI